MKLTGTNRPITYTTHHPRKRFKSVCTPGWYEETRLLASTMWFPTNKPRFDGRNQQQNNNTTPAFTGRNTCCNHRFPTGTPHRAGCGARVTAVIAWGKRPVPFRTRKLRPTAPMVLHPGGCGRVGHRRNTINGRGPPTHVGGPPAFNEQTGSRPRTPPTSRWPRTEVAQEVVRLPTAGPIDVMPLAGGGLLA